LLRAIAMDRSIEREIAADAYGLEMAPESWLAPVTPARAEVVIRAEAVKDPPSVQWGPVIGDIVHELRSALDQLVWALSVDHQPAPPPADPIPRDGLWQHVGFPVALSSGAWEAACREKLWAIDPAVAEPLRAVQPFETAPDAAEREPLAVLDELSHIDRHRHLELVSTAVDLDEVLTREPFAGTPDVAFELVSKRGAGPLDGRTELGRARILDRPGGVIAMTLPHVQLDPRLAVDVAFADGPPAHGGSVIATLQRIGREVSAVVDAF
jgi:hypothetical protein